jgi:hypothetical protein
MGMIREPNSGTKIEKTHLLAEKKEEEGKIAFTLCC